MAVPQVAWREDAFGAHALPAFAARAGASPDAAARVVGAACGALARDEPSFVDAVELFCDELAGL